MPDQKPHQIVQLVQAHLARHTPPGVKLEVEASHADSPYLMEMNSPAGQAAQRALRTTFPGVEPALIREGGSIPIVQTFKDLLGAESLLLGLALPDAKMHSPNENFPLENFHAGVRLNQALLRELAALTRKARPQTNVLVGNLGRTPKAKNQF